MSDRRPARGDPQPPVARVAGERDAADRPASAGRVDAHLRNGWIGLLLFVLFGIGLEALHAWKEPSYLGVGAETRRLMWTLAHAHGVGLSLIQLAFAATLHARLPGETPRAIAASRGFDAALVLIPGGFFLGGLAPYEADPGLGIVLVPLGALALFAAISCTLLELRARRRP